MAVMAMQDTCLRVHFQSKADGGKSLNTQPPPFPAWPEHSCFCWRLRYLLQGPHSPLHSPPLGFPFFSLINTCLSPLLWLYNILFIFPTSFRPGTQNQSDRAKQLRSLYYLRLLFNIIGGNLTIFLFLLTWMIWWLGLKALFISMQWSIILFIIYSHWE